MLVGGIRRAWGAQVQPGVNIAVTAITAVPARPNISVVRGFIFLRL
jgi:hypothetical protein